MVDGTRSFAKTGVVGLFVLTVGLAFGLAFGGPATAAKGTMSASMTVDHTVAYLNDTNEPFVFTVTNTGDVLLTEIVIAVGTGGITLPGQSPAISVIGCTGGPAGWTASVVSGNRCRWAAPIGSGVGPGSSTALTVVTSIAPGTQDRALTFTGTLGSSLLISPAAGIPGKIHAWEITDVVVSTTGAPTPGSACPAPRKQAPSNTTVGLVVCGINHMTAAATPSTATIGGSLISAPGPWSTGSIAPTATPVVLGTWTAASLNQAGMVKSVTATVASSANATSPPTTFTGYTTNTPPVAVADGYSTAEDVALTRPSGTGLLANDTDADGDALTVLAGSVTDPPNGTVTVSANGGFEYTPDPNFNGTDTFSYRATDGSAPSNLATVTITVTAAPDDPTDLAVSPATVPENQPVGAAVGTFTTTDPDAGDTFTYTLVAGTGDADNGAFQISGNQLQTNATFNFEIDSSYSVRVRTTDSTGRTYEEALAITITNVNEVPANLSLDNNMIDEDRPAGTVVGHLTATDPDAGDTFTWTMAAGSGDGDNASFTIVGNELRTAVSLAAGSSAIRVRGTDAGGLFREEPGTVVVRDVAEDPTDIALDDGSVAENQPTGTTVGNLSTTDPDVGNTFTYTLVSGTGDSDNGSFQISGNELQTAAVFDFEADSSYSIRVRTTDNTGRFFEEALTVTITDENDAPTDVSVVPSSIAEGQPINTVVGTLSATDQDIADTHTFTLVAGTGDTDNASFNVSGNQLRTSAVLDFEFHLSGYSIRVQADDGHGGTFSKLLTITATNVNEAPTNLALSPSEVAENQPTGTFVGSLTPTDHDPGGFGAGTFTLVPGTGDGDNASFQIDGSTLETAAVFDFEADNSYSVRVRATDAGGLFFEQQLTITVTDEPEAPTDLALSPSSVAENQPAGTPVGNLSTTDPDAGDTFTYTLVSGTGDGDNGSFQIGGNELQTNAVFDFEADSSYSIRVRTTDSAGLFREEQLTITITNANDGPTNVSVVPSSVAENQPVNTVVGTLSATDQDTADTHTFALVAGTGDADNASFNISGTSLRTSAVFDFEADSSFSIRVRATDPSGSSFEKSLTITITDGNDAPVAVDDTYAAASGSTSVAAPGVLDNDSDPDGDTPLTAVLVDPPSHVSGPGGGFALNADGSFAYQRETGSSATSDTFTYKVTDPSGAESNVATVTIAFNQPPTAVNDTATTAEDTGVDIDLTANDTDPENDTLTVVDIAAVTGGTAELQSDGHTVRFTPNQDLNSVNTAGGFSFTYRASDGSSSSNTATVTITVSAVNDAPVLAAIETTAATYSEQSAGTAITASLTVSDVDNTSLSSAQVRISAGFESGDELVFVNQNGISGSYASGTGVLTLNGSSSVANYQAALRSVTFRNLTNDNPSASRTIELEVNDGSADSNPATRGITITPVNDRPVVTLDAGTLGYTENGTAVVISPNATVIDVDNANLTGFQVDMSSGGFVLGQDTLEFPGPLPPGVTFSGIHPSGVMQFLGSATVAQYQALMRTITYRNTAESFTSTSRSIVFRVFDGTTNSADKTRNVSITAVNDAPQIADLTAASTYTEQDTTAALVSGGAAVSDLDHTNLASATLTISSPVTGDELTFTDQNGITGSFGAGVLTLTGSATVANYQAAIRSVGFQNLTSDNPGSSRTIGIKVNDGVVDSTTINRSVTITAVNDPPTNTVPGPQTGTEDVAETMTLSVADPDAASLKVTLTGTNGTVTLSGTAGLSVTGNGTGTVVATGTAAALNTAMTGLSFLGTANYNTLHTGDSSVTILTEDQGSSGTGGNLSDTDAVVVDLAAVNDAPVANAQAVTVQANMGLNDQALSAASFTDPDSGDPGYVAGFTLAGVTASSCTGCTVTDVQGAARTFDLDAGAGLTGSHTLSYTITDNGSPVGPAATSAPAAVNLTITGPVIWFLDDGAAPGGDGSMSNPFQVLVGGSGASPNDVGDVDEAGHRIFMYSGSYAQGIGLLANEQLIGQGLTGQTFDQAFSINPPSNTPARPTLGGTRPTITNITSFNGDNGVIRGVNIMPTSSGITGLQATGRTGITVNQVSLASNGGRALNFSNVAGTASFNEIDATGGSSGIVWDNSTSLAASLTVTGTGTANCTTAATCTGGAIQSTTGPGVVLRNLANGASLTSLLVSGSGGEGIQANAVAGFTLANGHINNNGDGTDESGVELTDVTGTATISDSELSRNSADNLHIEMDSVGSIVANVTGNVIKDNYDALEPNGNDGILVDGAGSANITLNASSNQFSNPDGDHIQVAMTSNASGTYVTNLTQNTFANTSGPTGSLGSGLTIGNGGSATHTVTIDDNDFTDAVVASITLSVGVATGTMNATIENNDIGTPSAVGSGGSSGVLVNGQTASTINVLIENNRINHWDTGPGIWILGNDTCPSGGACPSGTINATVLGNSVKNPDVNAGHGMEFRGGSTAVDTHVMCVDVGGAGALANDVDGAEFNGNADIRVHQRFGTTMRLRGYAGSASDTTAVQNYLLGRNTITTASAGTPGGTGYLNTSPAGAACPQP